MNNDLLQFLIAEESTIVSVLMFSAAPTFEKKN